MRLILLIMTLDVLGLAGLGITDQTALAEEDTTNLTVEGWPTPNFEEVGGAKPPMWLGDDPVIGRLMCPPLVRLNLQKNSVEPLLINEVTTHECKEPDCAWKWVFSLKNHLYFWQSGEMKVTDLQEYLQRELRNIVQEKTAGIWQIPEMKVDVKDTFVVVKWKEKPLFGPYILNGAPFWKATKDPASEFAYECVGLFRPKKQGDEILLTMNPQYNLPKREITFRKGLSNKPQASEKVIAFKMASQFMLETVQKSSEKEIVCQGKMMLPLMTVIAWNHEKQGLKDSGLRQILTGLTPRGALLRAGAGSLGDLTSSIIPRNHPGYNPQLLVRPFSLRESYKELELKGFVPPKDFAKQGKPGPTTLSLTIGNIASTHGGAVEKAIEDTYSWAGIELNFVDPPFQENIDGILTSIFLPWPTLDFLPSLHSRAGKKSILWPLKNQDLDKDFENYSLAMSQGKPDFNLLKHIHKHLFVSEPFSVLLHHGVCMDTRNIFEKRKFNINEKDPDWFKRLVL